MIKFIKIIGNLDYVKKNFELQNFRALHQDTVAAFIRRAPRILLELITVLAICLIILFLFKSGKSFESMLPLLTLLVVSLVRFIPSVGIILIGINQYKFHHVSLTNIYNIFSEHNKKIKQQNFKYIKNNTFEKIIFEKILNFLMLSFHTQTQINIVLKTLIL